EAMSKVRVHNFAVSLDGCATGEGQSLDAPFGHAGGRLMEWFFETRAFQSMNGKDGGSEGVDNAYAMAWGPGIGAEIMGRNKFGPQRGAWQDEEWKGWWGDNPPFHTPVFVLTHHPRPTLEMAGGNTFHFIDASPAEALARARGSRTVRARRLRVGPVRRELHRRRAARRWPAAPDGRAGMPDVLTRARHLVTAGGCSPGGWRAESSRPQPWPGR